MSSGAARALTARPRLVGIVTAIAALVALPGTALAASVFPFTGVGGVTGLQISGDDSRSNDIRMAWIGPASTPPGTNLEFILTDTFAMNASSPCAFSASFYRCPSGGVTDYLVTLGSSVADPDLENSFRFDGFARGSVAGPMQRGTVTGSPGDDRIITTTKARETANGLGGNDLLSVSAGEANQLDGGDGKDLIRAFRNGLGDFVRCGPGSGDIAVVDLQDKVSDPQNCSRILRAPADKHPVVEILGRKVKVGGGQAAIRLKCPKQATSKCRGKLRVKRGRKKGRKLGTSGYSLKKGKKATVRVRVGGARGTVRAIASEGKKSNRKTSTKRLKLR